MSQPTAYDRQASFTNFAAAHPTTPPPGNDLDGEFNAVKITLDETLQNLALIQRDDGALANGSVGPDQLSTEFTIGFTVPTAWATATGYTNSPASTVFHGTGFYRCLISHTSGVFATDLAAADWELIADLSAIPLGNASQIAFSATGDISSTNVQSALAEVDAEKAALTHTHVSTDISDSTAAGRAMLIAANAAAQRTLLSLGTAAVLDVGTTASKVVQLDGSAKLPAVDGSQLTGIPTLNGTPSAPQGRLTLTTLTAVLTTTVSAAATVYYTPYFGAHVPIYNGTSFAMTAFAELSQALSDSTLSPAAASTNKNYDIFVWSNAGTLVATRGPAWSSDTVRGTGAGTSEIDFTTAFPTNKVAIANGPAANRGTFVGTIRTNGSSTVDYIFGAVAASGTAASFGVSNMYNRVLVSTSLGDTTDTWAYSTATWRASNASSTMRVSFVRCTNDDGIHSRFSQAAANATGTAFIGISLDSISATPTHRAVTCSGNANIIGGTAFYEGLPGLGFHFLQAMEYSQAVGTTTWYGDNGSATASVQNGLFASLRL